MSFIVGILTFFLVVNCALLILLILIQLPKKDAGAGMAFGGAAADALFGAGSGNVLTKVTKYSTMIFFGLALILGFLQNKVHNQSSTAEFEKQVEQKQMQTPFSAPQPVTPPASQSATPPVSTPAAASTNNLLAVPLSAPTNAPEAPTQSK
ncbi:MAG: preprotein translocase subunit SecG [Verrucomicrobiota bacterium]